MQVTKLTAELYNVNMNSWTNWREPVKIQWKHWENLRHTNKNSVKSALHKE